MPTVRVRPKIIQVQKVNLFMQWTISMVQKKAFVFLSVKLRYLWFVAFEHTRANIMHSCIRWLGLLGYRNILLIYQSEQLFSLLMRKHNIYGCKTTKSYVILSYWQIPVETISIPVSILLPYHKSVKISSALAIHSCQRCKIAQLVVYCYKHIA